MKAHHITHHSSDRYNSASDKFEEDLYNSKLNYSIRHVSFIGNVSQENMAEAIKKSLLICNLAGINSKQHFKKIYVFDTDSGTLHTDWLMSKNGFNLVLMQLSSLNEKMAHWLWKLSNL